MDVVTTGNPGLTVLTAVAAVVALVLTGTVSGVFFAFSNSVMPGLDAIRPAQAIAAMVGMNRSILNPLFLVTFVGPPLAALLAGVLLLLQDSGAAWFLLAAAVVYLLGAIVPTARVNVPLNDALDAAVVPEDEAEADRLWSAHSRRWTRWNHWRAVASLTALLLVGLGLLVWTP